MDFFCANARKLVHAKISTIKVCQNIHRKYEYFDNEKAKQSLEISILKGWYLPNEKVSEAQILSGLYWEYIYFLLEIFKIWPK